MKRLVTRALEDSLKKKTDILNFSNSNTEIC